MVLYRIKHYFTLGSYRLILGWYCTAVTEYYFNAVSAVTGKCWVGTVLQLQDNTVLYFWQLQADTGLVLYCSYGIILYFSFGGYSLILSGNVLQCTVKYFNVVLAVPGNY